MAVDLIIFVLLASQLAAAPGTLAPVAAAAAASLIRLTLARRAGRRLNNPADLAEVVNPRGRAQVGYFQVPVERMANGPSVSGDRSPSACRSKDARRSRRPSRPGTTP